MEIHKPKAAHSLREFLIEIGTIICGILIALGLEQGVEMLHRRHLGEETEARIRSELRFNLTVAQERVALSGCFNEQLATIRDHLIAAGSAWQAVRQHFASNVYNDVLPPVFRTPVRPWPQDAWKTATTSGNINNLPAQKTAEYAALYSVVDQLTAFQLAEHSLSARLGDLAYDGVLTESDRRGDLKDLAALSNLEGTINFDVKRLLHDGSKLGLTPDQNQLDKLLTEQRGFRGACVGRGR